jgi:hypothetical protein
MKRRIILFCLAALLCVAAVVAYKYRASIFRSGDVSELYLRYADTEGVDATFIRGFQVNDTVSVDVTLLQATDSAGWERLVNDTKLPNDTKEVHNDLTQKRTVLLRYTPKGYMTHHTDSVSLNNDLMAIDWTEQTIAIFHITDKKQSKSIIMYNIKKTKHA